MATKMRTMRPPSGSISGLEGGLLSRKCDHYGETHGRPLAPYWGWRAAFCPENATIMARRMDALWLPSWGLEGGLLSRKCDHYGEMHDRPLAPYRGWRAAFCPGFCGLWRQGCHVALTAGHVTISILFSNRSQKNRHAAKII